MILKTIRVRLNTDTYTEDNEDIPLGDLKVETSDPLDTIESSVRYAIGRWLVVRPEEVVIHRVMVVPGKAMTFEGETRHGFRKWEVCCQRISAA